MPIPCVKFAGRLGLACLLLVPIILSSLSSSAQASISGTIFNDDNGLNDNIVNGVPSDAGGVNIVLYDKTKGKVAAVTAVATNGSYSFTNVTTGRVYALYITNDPVTIGQLTLPSLLLPFGWALAGENIGTGAGSDGIVDGILSLGTVSASVADADFGLFEICSGGTIYALSSGGEIRPFISPATSAALGPLINSAQYGGTPNSNCLAYNPVNGKFYYFYIKIGASQTFVSYDPSTNSYQTLSLSGYTGGEVVRGGITADGTGYYTIVSNGTLEYYDIAADIWTVITNTYFDQSGNDISSNISSNGSGDVALDGAGNLWMLVGANASATYTLYKLGAPLPTTAVSSVNVKVVSTGNLGTQPNGIAFSSAGEIYLTNTSPNVLNILNNDLTITAIDTISGGSSIDLTSCAFPMKITGQSCKSRE